MKKQSKINISLFSIALLAVLVGVFFNIEKKGDKPFDVCDMTENTCLFSFQNKDFSIEFVSSVVVEEEIFIKFDLPQTLKLENAWVEGVNMFMGRTPVMDAQTDEVGRYVTFLGSCNLEQMQWRLVFQLSNKNGQKQEFSAVFYTYL
jgi:hypothetical protein